ncbi:unnamed protein product, partial [Gongylonema pulchrum]|uniref:Transmembrane 9 superfamily member n=1 Tax=Gongylonema pulchrum TaxID=637853 RepID=A0A183DLR4_9BILA
FKFVPVAEANVHQALEYRNLQVAKVVSINKNEAWYGSAHLNEGTAEGIDYQGFHIKLSYGDDPYFFSNYVFILMAVPRVARDYPSPYFDSDNTDEEKHRRYPIFSCMFLIRFGTLVKVTYCV